MGEFSTFWEKKFSVRALLNFKKYKVVFEIHWIFDFLFRIDM